MKRRERMERKLEKRQEWAEGRSTKAERRSQTAGDLLGLLTPGQPILVGHHSEKRHRAHIERIDTNMRKSVEHTDMAAHHRGKAAGLEHQLANSIYSDDDNAIEQLEDKIAKLDAKRAHMRKVNAAWRKAKKPSVTDSEGWAEFERLAELSDEQAASIRTDRQFESYHPQPFPPYISQNMGGVISNAKKRIQSIKAQAVQQTAAEDAGGVLIRTIAAPWEGAAEYAVVTFAEKPERETINELKAAGFTWGGGSWHGESSKLPEGIEA